MIKEITALKAQQNDPNRVNVFIDGSFSFGISRFVGAWLRIGQKISDEEIFELKNKDSHQEAFQSAMHFLGYRNRSEHEVRVNLSAKGYGEKEIDDVIENLKSSGYVNDEKFASEWVENRLLSKPRGRRLLTYELKQKKVNPEKIDHALQNLPDEMTLALQAARKVIHRYKKMELDEFNKKITGFLIRRGFGFEVIREARKFIWEEALQKN